MTIMTAELPSHLPLGNYGSGIVPSSMEDDSGFDLSVKSVNDGI